MLRSIPLSSAQNSYQGNGTTTTRSVRCRLKRSLNVWYNSADPNKSTPKNPNPFNYFHRSVSVAITFAFVAVGAMAISRVCTPQSRYVLFAVLVLHDLITAAVVLPTSIIRFTRNHKSADWLLVAGLCCVVVGIFCICKLLINSKCCCSNFKSSSHPQSMLQRDFNDRAMRS